MKNPGEAHPQREGALLQFLHAASSVCLTSSILLFILLFGTPKFVTCQLRSFFDTSTPRFYLPDSTTLENQFIHLESKYHPAWLELMNDGKLKGKANLGSFSIGDPEGFHLPVSVYSGISERYENYSNPGLVNLRTIIEELIDPLGGVVSLLSGGFKFLNTAGKKKTNFSRLAWIYHCGVKFLQVPRVVLMNPAQRLQKNYFPNYIAALGCYVSTATWKEKDPQTLGSCWLSINYRFSAVSDRCLQEINPTINSNVITGWSGTCGLNISYALVMQISLSKYNSKNAVLVNPHDYQLTLSYALN